MARPLGRLNQFALRAEACRFALQVFGEREVSKSDMLDMIAFFERIQLEGAAALQGVYGAAPSVVQTLRVVV